MALSELHYFSPALQMQTAATVILPEEGEGPFHVMFLLHGLSDDHTIWLRRTSIDRYVSGLPLIVVMPNGGRGFYSDAIEGAAYETACGPELVGLIRRFYPTQPEWSVAGLSMGGYGAVKLALRYPHVFRSAVSHSGALTWGHYEPDLGNDWGREMGRIMGPNPTGGPNDLLGLADSLRPEQRPALRIDCGVDDFLLDQNREYHTFLNSIGYEHEYEEFPGAHTWDYWDVHVQEALAFHRRNLGF